MHGDHETEDYPPVGYAWYVVAVLTLATAGLGLPGPLIVEYLINHLYKRLPINLFGVFLVFLGVAAANGAIGYALTTAVTYLGQRFKLDMRRKLYAHDAENACALGKTVMLPPLPFVQMP